MQLEIEIILLKKKLDEQYYIQNNFSSEKLESNIQKTDLKVTASQY